MTDEPSHRGCCAVGIGGPYMVPGSALDPGYKHPWHITWLPRGYGPTREDRCVAIVAPPDGEDWGEYGLGEGKRPPLIEAICAAIEEYMAGRRGPDVWPEAPG